MRRIVLQSPRKVQKQKAMVPKKPVAIPHHGDGDTDEIVLQLSLVFLAIHTHW
jgi:hypothetical protein